jgi:UDP-2,3-diacylglucosamine hydrolase
MGEDKEHLVLFAKKYLKAHPEVDFFIFGHRHIELDLMLTRQNRLIILGDWITQFTYAEFSEGQMTLDNYPQLINKV